MLSSATGWDLIYQIIENDVDKKEDILIAFIHLVLINCEYLCIGLGDHKDFDIGKSTELLPPQWNADKKSYKLRYLKNGVVYLLKAEVADDILVSFLNTQTLVVNSVVFNVLNTVKALKGETLNDLIPNNNEILQKIQYEMISSNSLKEATTQTFENQSVHISDNMEMSRRLINPLQAVAVNSQLMDTYDYGHDDIDQLGGGRGGMIFNPVSSTQEPIIPGSFPRQSLPPNARMDPTRPPDERQQQNRFSPESNERPPDYDYL